MKRLLIFALALASCGVLLATPATITDPYGGAQPGGAANNGDVIGQLSLFDINLISFTKVTNSDIEMDILFNYDAGDTTLSRFNIGGGTPDLNVGDVLFSMGGNPEFGVALHGHDGLIAGVLYQITGGETAFQVLNYMTPSSTDYRPNDYVWMDPSGATAIGSGTVATSVYDHNEVLAHVAFTPTQSFLTDLASGMGVQFASATCGNDIIQGNIQFNTVPEPATFVLIGGALVGLGLLRRRKRG